MSTQPIALPSRSSPRNHISNAPNAEFAMSGSFTGSNGNGSFNPASYTRHFLGSPISWRSTSFGVGARLAGSPMDATMGSPSQKPTLDSNVVNAYGILEREQDFCRNYSCCGLHLNDLHALLEHFEEVHVVVIDPTSPQAQLQVPFNPQVISQTSTPSYQQNQSPTQQPTQSSQPQELQTPTQSYNSAFDPDEMDIEGPPPSATPSAHSSPVAQSPPDTPLSTTPLSGYSSPALNGQAFFADKQQQPPSPGSNNGAPVAAFDTKTFLRRTAPSTASATPPSLTSANMPVSANQPPRPTLNLSFQSPTSHSHPNTPHSPRMDPFNTYGRYAGEYLGMPGAKDGMDNFGLVDGARAPSSSSSLAGAVEECVPPALLFSNAASPVSTPSTSRVPSPQNQTPPSNVITGKVSSPSNSVKATAPGPSNAPKEAAARLSASMSRPATSLLLSKPFKCPKPNCNKSYKQANGLKYHMTHGSCNFAPPKDLEHVQAILERKRRDRAAAAAAGGQIDDGSNSSTPYGSNPSTPTSPYAEISDADMREVEREAERRLRPFACGVGDCARRYKNMNGLRYHYQHSGEHGTVGLAMLASGVHECLGNNNGNNSREGSTVRGEREGRKARGSVKSSPSSRATSLSRTGTPVSAASNPPATHPSQYAPSAQSGQYSSQLAYQQRFAEHQRAQYAQQQQHYHQQPADGYHQHHPIQPQPPQYASMTYTPNSVGLDVGMAS